MPGDVFDMEMKTKDAILEKICGQIVALVPAESILLAGSRATRQATEASDYDVAVIMRTFFVPLYLRRLKEIEHELSRDLGIDVVINPLPLFRVHRAKGNFFLYKLKREGVTLYGKDYIKALDVGEINDIGMDWHFSYLFSAMECLVQSFEPEFLLTKPDEEQEQRLVQAAAKAMLYCGQVHLLMNGYYDTNGEGVLSRLRGLNLPSSFLDDFGLSLGVKKGDLPPDALAFWFRVKEHLLTAFGMLMQRHLNTNSTELEELPAKYLKGGNKALLKNLQYFVLTLLMKKEIFWKSLLTQRPVGNRLRAALVWLLLSMDKGGDIDRKLVTQAHAVLKGYVEINRPQRDSVASWKHARDSIMLYWPFACTIMGV
jgi:predicted nucleotidyltransferase